MTVHGAAALRLPSVALDTGHGADAPGTFRPNGGRGAEAKGRRAKLAYQRALPAAAPGAPAGCLALARFFVPADTDTVAADVARIAGVTVARLCRVIRAGSRAMKRDKTGRRAADAASLLPGQGPVSLPSGRVRRVDWLVDSEADGGEWRAGRLISEASEREATGEASAAAWLALGPARVRAEWRAVARPALLARYRRLWVRAVRRAARAAGWNWIQEERKQGLTGRAAGIFHAVSVAGTVSAHTPEGERELAELALALHGERSGPGLDFRPERAGLAVARWIDSALPGARFARQRGFLVALLCGESVTDAAAAAGFASGESAADSLRKGGTWAKLADAAGKMPDEWRTLAEDEAADAFGEYVRAAVALRAALPRTGRPVARAASAVRRSVRLVPGPAVTVRAARAASARPVHTSETETIRDGQAAHAWRYQVTETEVPAPVTVSAGRVTLDAKERAAVRYRAARARAAAAVRRRKDAFRDAADYLRAAVRPSQAGDKAKRAAAPELTQAERAAARFAAAAAAAKGQLKAKRAAAGA